MKEEIREIEEICTALSSENRDYVLAVARALQFAQEKDTKQQTPAVSGKALHNNH